MPTSRNPRRIVHAALFAAVSLMCCAWADGAPVAGVLVLRNGNTLDGTVERLGDYYRVGLDGATFKVPADQVEVYCHSLQEAYEIRRRQRTGFAADGHLELAAWCLRQNLVNQAARELLDARTKEPDNPAIAALELQLNQALELDRLERPAPAAAKGVSAPSSAGGDESLAMDVSPGAQIVFVRSIQPMLIYNCATGGCHQTGAAQPMALDRFALDGGGSPALVRRNLAAVVAGILKDKPEQSPLLRRAREAHGQSAGARSKPLKARQVQLLEAWVDQAAGVAPTLPAAEAPETVQPAGYAEQDAFDPNAFNQLQRAKNAPPVPVDDGEEHLDFGDVPPSASGAPATE